MKKICVLLIAVLILNVVVLQTSTVSASDILTINEAEEILKFTGNLICSLIKIPRATIQKEGEECKIIPGLYGEDSYLTLDMNNEKPGNDKEIFCRIKSFTFNGKEYDISSLNNFKEMLKNYYTNEIADEFLNIFISRGNIRYDKEDELYSMMHTDGDGVGPRLKLSKAVNPNSSGNTASVNYIIFSSLSETEKYDPDTLAYFSVPAKFEKTQNGWRLDSLIFDLYYGLRVNDYRIESPPPDNPSTSSPTPIYLALAGAALVGVCLPVVKRKRRRI